MIPIDEIAFGKPADPAGQVADDVMVRADAQAVGKVRVNAQALNWFAGLMPVGGWIARLRLSAQPILRCLLSG